MSPFESRYRELCFGYNTMVFFSIGPLLLDNSRMVQKLTLLSGSPYFSRAATLGTLRSCNYVVSSLSSLFVCSFVRAI